MDGYALERQLQMPQGEVLPYWIGHDPAGNEDCRHLPEGGLRLRIRTEAGLVNRVEAILLLDGRPEKAPLVHRYGDAHHDLWEVERPATQVSVEYYFRLQTISGQALFGATGLQGSVPAESRFRVSHSTGASVPDWARGAVFYQIFPDRFDRPAGETAGLEPWASDPTHDGLKGGTLDGIRGRLDYLQDLGIEALWLNPIFASPSNHRYDTTDYLALDPLLGTGDDLHRLVEDLHARGMKVVLDGVFNHVSHRHPFFTDVLEHGRRSPYWDWFRIRRWPVREQTDEYYATWWGHGHLPQLNLSNEAVRNYLLEIGRYWLREFDVDGWRLDVAGEVPIDFWRSFRQAVREVKDDAYLLAEVWGDGKSFLQGDTFDATMNYPFRRTVLEFLAGRIDAFRTSQYLNRLYYRYSKETAEAQYNLLGSHDVSRLANDLGGDLRAAEMAFAIQCAYPGASAIYYGDELGLPGEGDPGCRRAFPWQQAESSDLRRAVARLNSRKRDTPALRTGTFRCEARSADRLRIEREQGGCVLALVVDRASGSYYWGA